MPQRTAPNKLYYKIEYAGADGVFQELVWTEWAEPLVKQPEVTDQVVRGTTIGNVVTMYPVAVGSITLMNIQSTPLQASPYARIVNGAEGFTGTNVSATTGTFDTSVRQVTLRKTYSGKNIQGASYYQDYTNVEIRFPENVTEADSGDTLVCPIKVYGTIGAQQSLT